MTEENRHAPPSEVRMPEVEWPTRPIRRGLGLALLAFSGLLHAAPPSIADRASAMATPTILTSDPASARVQQGQAFLVARFSMADAGTLQVDYTLRNQGSTPLAVFDRGDVHSILTKRLTAGNVPDPRFRQEGDGLTLSHMALPLPDPAPTSPPTPVAARVAPDAALEGHFRFGLGLVDAVKRVRWCLGVAPFNEDDFIQSSRQVEGVDLWSASFVVVDTQQLLCTPWFDLAAKRFES